MIVEFTIENFRSFKEKHTFSLLATKNKELSESNTFAVDKKMSLLKTAVIYGANASGKTNFFLALDFFFNFAIFSGPRKQIADNIEVDSFYFSKQTEYEPSFFEFVFIIKNDEDKNIRYRYGFSVTKEEVITEYLFAVHNVREITLFTREKQEIITTDHFREGGAIIKSTVRPNCSFLSICAQSNGEVAANIIRYFKSLMITSGLHNIASFTKKLIKSSDNNIKKQVFDFLHYADIQVKDLTVKSESVSVNELPQEYSNYLKRTLESSSSAKEVFFFGHDYFDNKENIGIVFMPEHLESNGTQKLFAYAIPVISALENGTPLFIDEFDTQLHPLILENIIKLFNSPDKNKKNAQLVISCHAVHILTNKNFRRDQIWFCEKDHYGATDLYSLVEYDEPVRNDAAFGKNYLQGRYGAQLVISCHAINILTNKNFRRDQIWFCEKDQYGATDLYSLVEYDEPIRNDAAFGKNYLQGRYGAIPYINEIALQIGSKTNET